MFIFVINGAGLHKIMNIVGIIAEYNPFHNGHKYHIDKIKQTLDAYIVVIMSSNFAQRGEPCIADKFCISQVAVECGVDLVLELPTPYSLSSAERFAFSAINILNKLKVINFLSFGVEADDISVLFDIVKLIESDLFNKELLANLKSGCSFPKARHMTLEKLAGSDVAQEIFKPNNILAIEYIKCLEKLNSDIKILPIKRFGAEHNCEHILNENISSALNLRNILKIKGSIDYWKNFVPEKAFNIYKQSFNNLTMPALEIYGERAVLAKLRSLSAQDIKLVQDVSEGLENRILRSIQNSTSLNDLCNNIKTKRYTMSRVKRIIYNLFLGINLNYFEKEIEYVRILGSNKRGLEVISQIKNKTDIPIDNKLIKLSKKNKNAKKIADVELYASNMYGLFCPKISSVNVDLTHKFVVY